MISIFSKTNRKYGLLKILCGDRLIALEIELVIELVIELEIEW